MIIFDLSQLFYYFAAGASREQALQIPPVWLNFHLRHISRPADGVIARQQFWKVSAHSAVQAGFAGVGFLQLRIQRDAPGDTLQFNDGHAHHESNAA